MFQDVAETLKFHRPIVRITDSNGMITEYKKKYIYSKINGNIYTLEHQGLNTRNKYKKVI